MSWRIAGFQGAYRFLSNFWPATVVLDSVEYPTVEHAYQAAKTLSPVAREAILACEGPGAAKRAGRRFPVRADWETIKVAVMSDLVRQKFHRHPALAEQLAKTGNAELVEDNAWGDRFWGVCRGTGDNRLGKILMDVRESLALRGVLP